MQVHVFQLALQCPVIGGFGFLQAVQGEIYYHEVPIDKSRIRVQTNRLAAFSHGPFVLPKHPVVDRQVAARNVAPGIGLRPLLINLDGFFPIRPLHF